jgi:catechol 2,3-dioxygenase-like lactoylglutathione lyase family enzyme
MLDHVSLGVADFDGSQAFYDAVLAPLGMKRYHSYLGAAGYGATPDRPVFWIGLPAGADRPAQAGGGTHLAFAAKDRPAVDAFHAAALAAGGRDNGAPGLRPQYHPNYYGAFVFDPDGHKIEACCHLPA